VPASLASLCAWLVAHGTSCVELVAFLFGAVSVYLSVRQNVWSWPTAIVNVGLYSWIFLHAGLYSDAGLQLVYLVLSVYGWYHWLYGGAGHTTLRVSRATRREWLVGLGGGVITWLLLGHFTSQLQGAAIPWLDAALTATSLVAQWMMTRKIVENWALWILADIVYVPTFLRRGLPLTAVLYAVFLVLAVLGLREWRRALREPREAADAGRSEAA
jgi:nicotinamide mononucleotide transporter